MPTNSPPAASIPTPPRRQTASPKSAATKTDRPDNFSSTSELRKECDSYAAQTWASRLAGYAGLATIVETRENAQSRDRLEIQKSCQGELDCVVCTSSPNDHQN